MIQLLETQFTGIGEVKEFNFSQVANSETHYLYEVNTGANSHYEVFERRTSPICLDFANRTYSEIDFKEYYPKSNAFGVWAWTYTDLEKARAKFNELNQTK